MTDIQPFAGLLYDIRRVQPRDVLTQPYDKITPAMRRRYLGASPYNLVRIELGDDQPGDTESANKYTRARDHLQQWIRDGVLRRSSPAAFYHLEQTFAGPVGSGPPLVRRGLVARVRLSRWEEGEVRPHEQTLSKPKADRLALLRACGIQQGQIFLLHPPPAGAWPARPGPAAAPVLEVTDDQGVLNRLWEIGEAATIRALRQALQPLTFYVADGHHRYETALAFRDECRAAAPQTGPDAPWEFVMATLVNMADPGLVILPTHRTVGSLAGFEPAGFRRRLAETFPVTPQPSLDALLTTIQEQPGSIGLADRDGLAVLKVAPPAALAPLFDDQPPLWDRLDVGILHVAILDALLGIDEPRLREETNLQYWREPQAALEQVTGGAAQLAFFLRPTPVTDVQAIADAGSRMPQKSTDFYPKLLSGMVMYEAR
ncbi:DUF1015 domain-containing protein [bacterium]|nr:DUF1015 domain-containing protein [bacterium]